ncbi:unnamed protein product [Ceutorhynchus assimilis]|uniref:Major facilitator superfamily (MFS) profile domain-containing protein n=1 Tax=Ceutorhynchus assimilis TaxID=467358 RepID=A0A9N9MVG4_9CUCU|nr:unnamed protein product [Ceutorhynchus assimilis]
MDPIGIKENARANLSEEDSQNEKLHEIICSVRSLSKYEGRSFRTLFPQIAAASIAASYHIVVGISLAYSGILIPNLVPHANNVTSDIQIVASTSETSWIGMVLTFLKGWFLDWRTVAWMCLGYSVIPVILITLFIPESPAWLVSKGKIEEAAKSLKWLHRNQPQPEQRTETLAELQLHLLQKEHEIKLEEASRKGTGFMVKVKKFIKPTGYKPLIILFGLFFFQQFSGIYITLFYSVTFFEKTRSALNPYLASTLIGTVRFAMSCINTYMLRTFHRRPLIMFSGLGMCFCMFFSGLFTMWIIEGE